MSINKIIRWAILGAGKIAHTFAKDFSFVEHAELRAVASRDKLKANVFALEYSIPCTYTYEELYQDDQIDIVYVATTHNFHFEHAKACIHAGKSVLVEKPVTINDLQFQILTQLARDQKVFLMEAMWTYFLPAIRTVKQWIDEGRIGNVNAIQSNFGYLAEKNLERRMYNPVLAGGSLLDLGVYNVAFVTFFMNTYPNTIQASGKLFENKVDEQVSIILSYNEGETISTMTSSMVANLDNTARIFGSEGYIEIPLFWRMSDVLLYNNGKELVETYQDDRSSNGFCYQIQHATNNLLNESLESDIATHVSTSIVMRVMDEVRNQIGLKYPMEL
jgi:predicted dehydrogenase